MSELENSPQDVSNALDPIKEIWQGAIRQDDAREPLMHEINRFSFSTRTGVFSDEEGNYVHFSDAEVLRAAGIKHRQAYLRCMHECDARNHTINRQDARIRELEKRLEHL
jgi:hypothetical protein